MNTNKVVNATKTGISVNYTDTNKHFFIYYDKIEEKKVFKNYQDVVNLNPKQIKIYRLAIYGVEALSEQEYKLLTKIEVKRIISKQKHTQKLINRWKQQIVQIKVNSLLSKLFPKSSIISELISDNDYYSDTLINNHSFKELGITKKTLIDKLIELKCLPINFYNIA